jgi:NTP pyrophosphatase (non-canonical NTP hydrolase)
MQTTSLIKQWAIDRGLDKADANRQMLKLVEEVGELAAAMARNNRDNEVDAIGDIYVVLTILSMQLGYDVETCIQKAYDVIKLRTGRMVNGVFIKNNEQ